MTFARGGIIELPWMAKALSPNHRSRSHWPRTRAIQAARKLAWGLTLAERIKVPCEGPIAVTVTFRPPTRHSRDGDNLLASCKAYFDGIADALKCNDSRFRHQAPVIGSPIKGGKVFVHIEVAE